MITLKGAWRQLLSLLLDMHKVMIFMYSDHIIITTRTACIITCVNFIIVSLSAIVTVRWKPYRSKAPLVVYLDQTTSSLVGVRTWLEVKTCYKPDIIICYKA